MPAQHFILPAIAALLLQSGSMAAPPLAALAQEPLLIKADQKSLPPVSHAGEIINQQLADLDHPFLAELTGSKAQELQRQTGAHGPVYLQTSVIKRFRQPGCARVNVRTLLLNTPTTRGDSVTFYVDTGLNICQDGSPPNESIDLGSMPATKAPARLPH